MISKLPLVPISRGSQILQLLLQHLDDAGADDRAPHVADAADHRHEQVLDALVQAEGGRFTVRWKCANSQPDTRPAARREHEEDDP